MEGVRVYRGWFGATERAAIAEATWSRAMQAVSMRLRWWHEDGRFISAYFRDEFLLDVAARLPESATGVELEPSNGVQQLVIFPGAPEPYVPHRDALGTPGSTREFSRIVGVHLSESDEEGGCFCAWDGETRVAFPTSPGDVICMDPDILHGAGANSSPAPRVAVYYRLLNERTNA